MMKRKKQPSSLQRGLKALPHKSVVKLAESRAKKRSPSPSMNGFPIVGIGASAGGLEALTQLLTHLPIDTGMGFVLLQHLDPKHESMSPEILSRATRMMVTEVKDGIRVQPNCVYVLPPDCGMEIQNGVLNLLPRIEVRGVHLVIDFFLQSLAQELKNRAVGVILSGTGSDGTPGLMAIKAEGGITLAQDPNTAKFDGMPQSAIDSGAVDLVLSPQRIA
jgi:two-component system CheB/CheR fusion protein